MLAAGGTDWTHTFEVFDQHAGWGTPIPTPTGNWPAYPNMLLMRDGRVFFTGIHFDSWPMPPVIFDVTANTMTAVPGLAPADGRGMGSSVILPPAGAQRVMVFGGGGTGAGALKNTSIVDLSVAAPHYVNGPNMIHPRTMQNTVILPDRTIFVSGGGCSGMQYGMAFDDQRRADDMVIDNAGVQIVVDDFSVAYIRGSEIDYVDSLMGAGFTVHNPNAVHSCSCGHSFDTGDDAGGAQACGCGH